jgi:ABC-type phosphate transport system substrate-binding protein
MRACARLLATILLCLTVMGSASASELIVVIVNEKNPTTAIGKEELRKIYEDRMLKWADGTPITVYDLAVNDPVRESFYQTVFDTPSEKMAEMWAHLKITNQAKNPPISVKNEYRIMKMVSMEEGAIGYVTLSSAKSGEIRGLKVIATLQ